jgi:hypothetical protein
MSDMLEQLLGVEKNAAQIVADAEAEASRRTSQTRLESQRATTEFLKTKAQQSAADVDAERARLAAERTRLNAEYRQSLSRMAQDKAGFRRVVLSFMDKGRT